MSRTLRFPFGEISFEVEQVAPVEARIHLRNKPVTAHFARFRHRALSRSTGYILPAIQRQHDLMRLLLAVT
jgi:hypothetical protein